MRESPLPGFAGEAGLLDGRVVVAIAKCMAMCGLRPEDGRVALAHNAHLHEQSYVIARGVRPLALVGQCKADTVVRSRLLARLSRHGDVGAVPFVCEREDGTAEYGYAAAQWAIDLYRWVVNEKADDVVPSCQRHRIIGLLLGYSAAAISDFETAAGSTSTSGSSA
jgi:hypothetical protein